MKLYFLVNYVIVDIKLKANIKYEIYFYFLSNLHAL